MEIWHRSTASTSTYLDVSATPEGGYRILRQVIGRDDEVETNWQLSSDQARQLLAALDGQVLGVSLEPVDPESRFDRMLMGALEKLEPPPSPVTFHSRD